MRETEIINGIQVVYNSGKEATLKRIGQYLFDLVYKKILKEEEIDANNRNEQCDGLMG